MRRLLPALLLVALPASLRAQSHDGAFIVRLGTDTVAVERFSRGKGEYSVEQARRVPRTTLWHTHIGLAPDGGVGEIFLMNHSLERMDAPLLASTRLVSRGDSATVETKRGDSTRTRSLALGGGAIPSLPQSFLAYELAAMQLRRSGADSASVVMLSPSGDTSSVLVRRVGADSMTFQLPFFTYRAKVDADGRISGLYQPLGTTVERAPDVDVTAIAKTWAALDAAGRAMGPLSPFDSTTARVGTARVTVRYSRPRSRGREVFGNLVPYDQVWRTGANAATVLETDRDLVIGTTPVPAGRYTLFIIPSRTSSTLVISRETTRDGQPLAGTDYDPKQDLARIPMTTRTIAKPVDQVTIGLVPTRANAATLHVVWDRREMTVPVQVR